MEGCEKMSTIIWISIFTVGQPTKLTEQKDSDGETREKIFWT